jgi:hypothetical protein
MRSPSLPDAKRCPRELPRSRRTRVWPDNPEARLDQAEVPIAAPLVVLDERDNAN